MGFACLHCTCVYPEVASACPLCGGLMRQALLGPCPDSGHWLRGFASILASLCPFVRSLQTGPLLLYTAYHAASAWV